MKRNKAINVTKRDIRSAIVEDRSYCYHYYPENARTHVRQSPLGYYNNFKDLDLQNVSNWSHLTCSCRDSIGKYQEASYFTTKMKQMQPRVTDIGVGNVKAYQRRKAKRIYVPQTEERAIGTSVNDYPKCHHFNEVSYKNNRNFVERATDKKKHLLNKKLSPLVRKKSNYTNPLNILFRKQDLEHNVSTTQSLHNRVDASTQMGTKELEKSTKIKIFKELAINTELLENGKPLKSEVELSVEMSRILSNKMGTGSSLDSLVQHVYNLDKPCNATLSTATIDPMENKLEREYRKIFSNQSKDCACNNKVSAANSDSLLRRFEALRRDMSLKEIKKNMSKSSSPGKEPKYKDVSVDSDGVSLPESDKKKIKVSPISSDYSEARKKDKGKKKSKAKLQKSSYWRRSDVDSDHQTKGRFKLWGRKVSADGSHKKSKIKCTESKKKSEASVKFSKLLKSKSSVKKEGKKFRFFKKKTKAAPRSRTDVMTGRCEVREGMSIQIGKGLLPRDYNTNAIQKFRLKYEDKLLNAWIRNFLTKSDEPGEQVTTKYSGSMESNSSSSTDIGENSSSDTDIQQNTTATVTNNSSFHGVNQSPFMNFSNQYIQAWMLTKTILDRLVKPKIYWNARTDKCNKKKNSQLNKYFDSKDTNPKSDAPPNNDTNVKEKITPKPKSIKVDISLGCISGLIRQSFMMQSNEEVCKIIDYETPRQSTVNTLKQNFEKEKCCNEIINEVCMKDITNCRFNNTEDLNKTKRSYSAGIFQDNELGAHKTCNAVGIEIATQKNLGKFNYPVYDIRSTESGDDLDGTVYLLPKAYKRSDNYLRKYYHNWNPLDLDLWCISDTNLQPSYNRNKDINSKSYSNMTDDIQFTTLVSSGETFANCAKDKRKRSLLKNRDYINNNIGIRITPKDSLEVCKKRKLYSDSNKGRWKHDELSVSLSSSTKSKHHYRKFISLRPNKKRVTISNYEVDKESKSIVKENERKKNLQCLSSSCHVSDSIQLAKKLPAKLEKKPTRQNIAITATSSNITNRTSNNPCDIAEVKCLKSASKDNLLNATDSCITNWKRRLCCDYSTDEEKRTCEKINDTKSGFFTDYFKPSSVIKNKYHSLCRKFVTDKKSSDESIKNSQNSCQKNSSSQLREQMRSECKKCAITTDVQKLSNFPTSVEDKSCGVPCTDLDVNKRGKLIGLHFKKQPVKKNVSRACWTVGDKMESNGDPSNTSTKVSSKETVGLNYKCPRTSPTVSKSTDKENKKTVINKEINNVCDKNKAEDTLNKTAPCVIEKNIEIQPKPGTSDSGKRICLGIDTCADEQSNDKSDSDFIEIVFKIRCKHGEDRAMIVNIRDSKDRIIKDNRFNLCDRDSDDNNKNKEVYLLQNESRNSTLRKNSKNCMNVKILIKSGKNEDLNKIKDLRDNSNVSICSKKLSEKLESISSETIKAVNNYAYSVHKFTIDLTKSVKSNNASKENYDMLHSNDKGTVMSESDFQKAVINITDTNDNGINRKYKHYNTSKTSDSRKSKHPTNDSSASLRPYRRHSLIRQMSNYKHIKNKVLQKILHCAKDFNKGVKKDKRMRKRSNVMPSLDYSNRNIDQNVNRLSKEIKASTLYSHFLNATSSYGYCHFDSVVRVRPRSNVNNYLFTVETQDRHKKCNPSLSTKDYERRKKHTKTLATKHGLTDIRRRKARRSARNSESYQRRIENIKRLNQIIDKNDYLDLLYDLSNYVTGRRCELRSYSRKHDNKNVIDHRKPKLDKNKNLSKLKINGLNKGIVCISDKTKITIVSSKFREEKCIGCHETGLEETSNHRKEMFDIFQLTEIKKAVFEMYNSIEASKSELLVKLPKFESDVETALVL